MIHSWRTKLPSWVIIMIGMPFSKYKIQGRMDKLHQSQVKAYHDAATKAVKDWAVSVPLQPMEDGDSKSKFVERCIASRAISTAGTGSMPNWHLSTAKSIVITEIRNRAIATYDKYHPVDQDGAEEGNGNDAGSTNEADNGDNGSETEEGEMTGDDVSDEDGEVKATKPTTAKYVHPNRNKKGGGNKVLAARKKGMNAKAGLRSTRGGRGGRRGGRGRANGK
mmetsp:Transcript_499/g.1275  ORF Transcript_499/g.1275 Transcript_499/m.1275 type:complete len:222 (+) Transcript_499:1193-1858(+)